MSSHNIDQSSLLNYLCSSLQVFGIYIKKQVIKSARDDKLEARPLLIRLLFDLALLHLIDYQYTIDQLGLQHEKIEGLEMQQIILVHLSQLNCPYLIRRYRQDSQKCILMMDKNSSRSVLILIGWVMLVSGFFSNIKKQLHKIYNNLYIDKIYQDSHNIKKTGNIHKTLHKDNQHSNIQCQYKKLRSLNYKIECLISKRQKLEQKLQSKIKKYNKLNKTDYHVKFGELLKDAYAENSQEFYVQENRLIMLLKQQKEGMRNQQYFWKWLQIRVVNPYEKWLAEQYSDYFQQPQNIQNFNYRIKPSTEYLSKYIKTYTKCQQNINIINQTLQSVQSCLQADLKGKKGRETLIMVKKEIQQEINQILNEDYLNTEMETEVASFFGIELKKYLQKHGFKFGKKSTKKQKVVQNQKIEIDELKAILREEIKEFIGSIDAIKFL